MDINRTDVVFAVTYGKATKKWSKPFSRIFCMEWLTNSFVVFVCADRGSKHIFSVTGSIICQYSLKEMTEGYGKLQQERLGPRLCSNGDGGGPRPDD